MKIKAFTAVIILAFGCVMIADGQRRRTARPRPTPSATPSPSPTPATGALSIEAGLVFESGDVKPVARTQFYLLDEDLRVILKPFGETPGTLGSQLDFLSAFSDSENAKANYAKLKAAIEPHIVATATTGFDGKAKLADLSPGTRFVYGETQVGRTRVAWNLRVEIKPGTDTAVILDNSNRSY
jgi:hypothetical protein